MRSICTEIKRYAQNIYYIYKILIEKLYKEIFQGPSVYFSS